MNGILKVYALKETYFSEYVYVDKYGDSVVTRVYHKKTFTGFLINICIFFTSPFLTTFTLDLTTELFDNDNLDWIVVQNNQVLYVFFMHMFDSKLEQLVGFSLVITTYT